MARTRKDTVVKTEVLSNMIATANGESIEKRVDVKIKDKLMQHGTHTVYLGNGKFVVFKDGVANVAESTKPVLEEMGII